MYLHMLGVHGMCFEVFEVSKPIVFPSYVRRRTVITFFPPPVCINSTFNSCYVISHDKGITRQSNLDIVGGGREIDRWHEKG